MLLRVNDTQAVRLAEGTKLSLDIGTITENGNSGAISFSSSVEEVLDDKYFLVHAPIHKGSVYPLSRGDVLQMYFMAKRINSENLDMFSIGVRFGEYIKRQTIVMAKLEPLGRLKRSQRRNSYRVPISIPVSVLRERGWTPPKLNAITIDFSEGGMMLITDDELEKNEKVNLAFFIDADISIEGEVLRIDKTHFGQHKFSAAVKFSSADSKQKELFYQYVLKIQIENRQRQNIR